MIVLVTLTFTIFLLFVSNSAGSDDEARYDNSKKDDSNNYLG